MWMILRYYPFSEVKRSKGLGLIWFGREDERGVFLIFRLGQTVFLMIESRSCLIQFDTDFLRHVLPWIRKDDRVEKKTTMSFSFSGFVEFISIVLAAKGGCKTDG